MAHPRTISLCIVGLVFVANLHLSEANIGVVYGTKGDNLPTPQEVLALIASNNITQVRLLEPNKDILTALKGKNISVFLGFPNTNLTTVLDPSVAENWVAVNVKPYVPDVKIKYVVVGNHVSGNSGKIEAAVFGFDFMKKMHSALQNQGFKDIKVTTSCDFSMFQQSEGNPVPSAGVLLDQSGRFLMSSYIDPRDKGVLPFLSENGAPFLINLYPGFELIMHPNGIKPEFALFNASGTVVTDGKLGYQNLFDVQLDTFYNMLEKLGFPDMEIIVGETGWSTGGGAHANLDNAKTYITNLIQHVNKGTPKRPNKPIQVFIDLLDEDKLDLAEIDKHLGLFTADGKIKFPVSFNPSA